MFDELYEYYAEYYRMSYANTEWKLYCDWFNLKYGQVYQTMMKTSLFYGDVMSYYSRDGAYSFDKV